METKYCSQHKKFMASELFTLGLKSCDACTNRSKINKNTKYKENIEYRKTKLLQNKEYKETHPEQVAESRKKNKKKHRDQIQEIIANHHRSDETRKCTKCKVIKDISEFNRSVIIIQMYANTSEKLHSCADCRKTQRDRKHANLQQPVIRDETAVQILNKIIVDLQT